MNLCHQFNVADLQLMLLLFENVAAFPCSGVLTWNRNYSYSQIMLSLDCPKTKWDRKCQVVLHDVDGLEMAVHFV